jgi:hypothetical protein
VKPQTAAFLDKGRELLERADTMLAVGLNEDAGRTAYLAGFHAAQAFSSRRQAECSRNTLWCKASLGGW